MFKINWEKTSSTHLCDDIIRQMVHLIDPSIKLTSYKIIEGGCANINIIIKLLGKLEPLVLRIYVRDKNSVYRELKIASLVQNLISVPVIRHIGELDNYRFSIVDFIEGVPLRDFLIKNLYHPNPAQLMYDAGTILSKIASFKFEKSGFFDLNLDVISDHKSNSDLLNFANYCLKNHTVINVLGTNTISMIDYIINHRKDLLPNDKAHNLVHGDFDPANILVNEINGHFYISGILDWEFAFSGSILWDVANMLRYAHHMPGTFTQNFINALKDNGIILPDSWPQTVNLLNIISLLDCLSRADTVHQPRQCDDINRLIKFMVSKLSAIKKT